jgi:transcription termination factor Rho
MAQRLEERHLADLHALAADLGIPRYRMLRRPELIREIERRSEPQRDRERLTEADNEETKDVRGILEITPQRHGFLRLYGLEAADDDVYVSASQVRRCELRSGDEVSGPARAPRRGEHHRALVHVDRVNGGDPQAEDRPQFERLTPVLPTRRIPLDSDRDGVLVRAVDLLAPLALGQRVLVEAAPRSGRTTLLRELANAIARTETAEAIVMLIDERPEEATAWQEAAPNAEVATATADLSPAEQVGIARLALERAKRRAEAGRDSVLVCDSLSRLAVATGDAAFVKQLFGAGRDLDEEGAGSLTVIATTLEGAEDDGLAHRAVATTESSLVKLDPGLAAAGVVPALAAAECRISNEDQVREPEELEAARRLRSLLADLDPVEAARLLRERIEGSATNAELLRSL